MKSFIGSGSGTTAEAVAAATRGLDSPSAILFISPYEQLEATAEILAKKYPGVPHIGTIGTNFVNGAVSDKAISVLGFFSDAKVSFGLITGISACPVAFEKEIIRKLSEVAPGKDDTVCIEYCTGAEEKLVTTFTACLAKRGVALAGGTTFGAPAGKNPAVAYNGKVYEDACVYGFIKNTTGKVRVYKENIYENRSGEAHFATKVDVARKALVELDNRPAADVYSAEIGIPRDQIIGNVLKNPMGRAVGDEVFISSMMDLEANGTLVNYKRINKNDCIYFLTLGDYDDIERRTREKIKQEAKKVSLVVSIDCIYRYLLYDAEKYVPTYARNMASLGPHIGVVGGGEQFNNQHVNQTMVCAVFE